MGKKASNGQGGELPKWGKGKTDEATWFKPGCKAGPGRPKGSKNSRTIWQEANAEKVTVKVNGKTTQVAKGPLKYKQLVGKAASGDGSVKASCPRLYRTASSAGCVITDRGLPVRFAIFIRHPS